MKIQRKLAGLSACALVLSSMTVPLAQAASFADTDNHWAKDSIDRWANYDVIQGFTDATYKPNNSMTRAQMASILTKLLGLKKTTENPFTDVASGAWYEDAILKCAAAGIMKGTSETTANPTGTITREQASTMLARALGIAEDKSALSFDDSGNVADWAAGYVKAMADRGILNGVGENQFKPKAEITRAAVATILDRSISAYANTKGQTIEAKDKGITLIVADGVTVQGSAQDVLLSPAAEGTTTLDGVKVSGTVTVNAPNATVEVAGAATVANLVVASEADSSTVHVAPEAKVDGITAAATNATLNVEGKVGSVTLPETAAQTAITVAKNAEIGTVNSAADTVKVTGAGKIVTMNVTGGKGVAVASTVSVGSFKNSSANNATYGNKVIVAQKPSGSTNVRPSSGGSGGSGGSGSGPSSSTTYYTIVFDANYDGAPNPVSQSVTKDATLTGSAPSTLTDSRPGFEVEGWYSDKECTTAVTSATSALNNTTVYAKWRSVATFAQMSDAIYDKYSGWAGLPDKDKIGKLVFTPYETDPTKIHVTGTLPPQIEDFTGFSSDTTEQSGTYAFIQIPVEATSLPETDPIVILNKGDNQTTYAKGVLDTVTENGKEKTYFSIILLLAKGDDLIPNDKSLTFTVDWDGSGDAVENTYTLTFEKMTQLAVTVDGTTELSGKQTAAVGDTLAINAMKASPVDPGAVVAARSVDDPTDPTDLSDLSRAANATYAWYAAWAESQPAADAADWKAITGTTPTISYTVAAPAEADAGKQLFFKCEATIGTSTDKIIGISTEGVSVISEATATKVKVDSNSAGKPDTTKGTLTITYDRAVKLAVDPVPAAASTDTYVWQTRATSTDPWEDVAEQPAAATYAFKTPVDPAAPAAQSDEDASSPAGDDSGDPIARDGGGTTTPTTTPVGAFGDYRCIIVGADGSAATTSNFITVQNCGTAHKHVIDADTIVVAESGLLTAAEAKCDSCNDIRHMAEDANIACKLFVNGKSESSSSYDVNVGGTLFENGFATFVMPNQSVLANATLSVQIGSNSSNAVTSDAITISDKEKSVSLNDWVYNVSGFQKTNVDFVVNGGKAISYVLEPKNLSAETTAALEDGGAEEETDSTTHFIVVAYPDEDAADGTRLADALRDLGTETAATANSNDSGTFLVENGSYLEIGNGKIAIDQNSTTNPEQKLSLNLKTLNKDDIKKAVAFESVSLTSTDNGKFEGVLAAGSGLTVGGKSFTLGQNTKITFAGGNMKAECYGSKGVGGNIVNTGNKTFQDSLSELQAAANAKDQPAVSLGKSLVGFINGVVGYLCQPTETGKTNNVTITISTVTDSDLEKTITTAETTPEALDDNGQENPVKDSEGNTEEGQDGAVVDTAPPAPEETPADTTVDTDVADGKGGQDGEDTPADTTPDTPVEPVVTDGQGDQDSEDTPADTTPDTPVEPAVTDDKGDQDGQDGEENPADTTTPDTPVEPVVPDGQDGEENPAEPTPPETPDDETPVDDTTVVAPAPAGQEDPASAVTE